MPAISRSRWFGNRVEGIEVERRVIPDSLIAGVEPPQVFKPTVAKPSQLRRGNRIGSVYTVAYESRRISPANQLSGGDSLNV